MLEWYLEKFPTQITLDQFLQACWETVVMVSVSLLIGIIIGSLIGITLVLTRPGGIRPHNGIYVVLNWIVNITRSLPFIILLVAILPFTKWLVQTSIGTPAAIVPLVVYISPFIGRLVESSLLEVDKGIIEAANSMGATTFQTVWKFLLPEARGSLILNFTTAIIGLIGATAMAGAVGAGGIGDLAINYGYHRYDNVAMFYTVITLIIVVQTIQSLGNFLAKRYR
ncbi:methionine ABC transporter permease [Ignatzschineria cameli]|uniref:Methionine ABC transporter permease n=1 Tax=Ignatzschineria cameli TaxID=2182793 RepID=A0A2U2AKM1_9GAMM|nr:methionine ABC transporter permease [Ignatzschineria cameli]PWD83578.1 methionine ABC transporter permease [Ignatzschineria cameli]PWD83743.1 methionine ABC transporter permease [Ignatzschineria cameli]PWD88560.1 methionine ABC transporter permease [Ignatzschineria cameli]PWD89996.1 methionine ABC transporter permease [Ignatzschineria cameli]PWD90056.1 methionine ABC transporter permease [Ignatzschineria cameli]